MVEEGQVAAEGDNKRVCLLQSQLFVDAKSANAGVKFLYHCISLY